MRCASWLRHCGPAGGARCAGLVAWAEWKPTATLPTLYASENHLFPKEKLPCPFFQGWNLLSLLQGSSAKLDIVPSFPHLAVKCRVAPLWWLHLPQEASLLAAHPPPLRAPAPRRPHRRGARSARAARLRAVGAVGALLGAVLHDEQRAGRGRGCPPCGAALDQGGGCGLHVDGSLGEMVHGRGDDVAIYHLLGWVWFRFGSTRNGWIWAIPDRDSQSVSQ